jgi:hypothetical protein
MFEESPSRLSEAEAGSSTFWDSFDAADSTGLGEETGVVFGLGIDSRVGPGSGTTACSG